MCGNGIYSTPHWKVIQLKRAFLGEALESKLRPCSRNENIINENKISYLQIAKTVSNGQNIHRGQASNSKQKKLSSGTTFETFNQPILSLKDFQFWDLSNNSMNLQVDR